MGLWGFLVGLDFWGGKGRNGREVGVRRRKKREGEEGMGSLFGEAEIVVHGFLDWGWELRGHDHDSTFMGLVLC